MANNKPLLVSLKTKPKEGYFTLFRQFQIDLYVSAIAHYHLPSATISVPAPQIRPKIATMEISNMHLTAYRKAYTMHELFIKPREPSEHQTRRKKFLPSCTFTLSMSCTIHS